MDGVGQYEIVKGDEQFGAVSKSESDKIGKTYLTDNFTIDSLASSSDDQSKWFLKYNKDNVASLGITG